MAGYGWLTKNGIGAKNGVTFGIVAEKTRGFFRLVLRGAECKKPSDKPVRTEPRALRRGVVAKGVVRDKETATTKPSPPRTEPQALRRGVVAKGRRRHGKRTTTAFLLSPRYYKKCPAFFFRQLSITAVFLRQWHG